MPFRIISQHSRRYSQLNGHHRVNYNGGKMTTDADVTGKFAAKLSLTPVVTSVPRFTMTTSIVDTVRCSLSFEHLRELFKKIEKTLYYQVLSGLEGNKENQKQKIS
jgi:hypothetical protein